jgi:hypothetical protein
VSATLTKLESLVGQGDEANLAERTVELISQRAAADVPVDDLTG